MKLALVDGSEYGGKSFGAAASASGEIVFNTGMVGYVESLTDPSYAGQILVLTYPLIGNYGVPDKKYWESKKIQIAGLIVSEHSESYSHHAAKKSLSDWLKENGVPAISGVDTRALTKKLREHGVILGQLISSGRAKHFTDPNKENLVGRVSLRKKQIVGQGKRTIVLVDCGAKENILRSLVSRLPSQAGGVRVIRVPWNYDFNREKYDALVISNGPGDPTQCASTIENIRKAMSVGKPILGICLGNQLLALAAGAKTYKLKYGHRSQNQPCINAENGRCYITSQNHGFAVDEKTLPSGWKVWFTNANDGTNEGIKHDSKPWRSVQFHPEATPGPTDTNWIFDDFINSL